MKSKNTQLLLLLSLVSVGVWLWFSKSGKSAAKSAGAVVASGAHAVREVVTSLTRGERNNNPGNIRKSANNWQGKINGTDAEFESFDSPENGVRALGKLLLTYASSYNLRSIRGMITRWAPPTENDTEGYIRHVVQLTGVSADTNYPLSSVAALGSLVKAIIRHENGRVIYPDNQIANGVQKALA